MAVPGAVIDAFGLSGTGERLDGGLGPAFRFGDVVVKPVDDAVEAAFIASVMAAVVVDETKVRVARPAATQDGRWVAEGWAASHRVEGRQLRSNHPWPMALTAIAALHDGLEAIGRDPVLDGRGHRWAVADGLAWGEAATSLHPRIEALVGRVQDGLTTTDAESQLIHGDCFSNLLFADGLAPAVIDFSPYWRPGSWATAIYVVDAVAWGGGDQGLLDLLPMSPEMHDLLRRAAIFRLVALDGYRRELGQDIESQLPAYESMVDTVMSLSRPS
jgi:uncharacterized protein (TIGR02569 family)